MAQAGGSGTGGQRRPGRIRGIGGIRYRAWFGRIDRWRRSEPARRAIRWLRRFATQWNPQKFAGALLVAVLGGVIPVALQQVMDDGSNSSRAQSTRSGPASGSAAAPQTGCSGKSCTNIDPNAAHCFEDAVTIADRETPILLQIRYSSRCHAGWARIQKAQVGDEVSIQIADGVRSSGLVQFGEDALTRMVPAESGFQQLKGCADADTSTGRQRWASFCITATSKNIP
jgi:Protein of unknown function (DUF2690)